MWGVRLRAKQGTRLGLYGRQGASVGYVAIILLPFQSHQLPHYCHITHIQHTSILPTLILTSVVHHPPPPFTPTLTPSNPPPPFCRLVTKIFQSLHSRSCPASLEQTPAS